MANSVYEGHGLFKPGGVIPFDSMQQMQEAQSISNYAYDNTCLVSNSNCAYDYTLSTITTATTPNPLWTQAFSNLTNPFSKMVKFFRINRACEMAEGAKYEEPLDELRVKVAKWLKR